jgi:CheY-like chemotaxis protein
MSTTLRPKPPSARFTPLETGPRVLVIDDDAMLRRALVRGLKRRHVVIEHDDAEVALAEIASGDRYDAIVCDLNLGGMTGRQFLFALHAILPEQAAKVVILSGAARATLDDPLLAIVGPRFVEKPATLAEIEHVLDDVFGARAHAA